MDDWSLLPSRTAVSEAAPNPQSTMTTTTTPLPDELTRVKRPQPAPITHARKTRRLTPPSSPGNHATNPGQSPKTPINRRRSMPHRNQSATPKVKDLERTLDITRPFMDDIGGSLTAGAAPVYSAQRLATLMSRWSPAGLFSA